MGNDRELVLETIFAGGLANHVSVAIRAKSKDALGDPALLGTAGLEPSEHPILEILKDPRVSPVPEWAIWFGEGMSPPGEVREVASCFAAASGEDTLEAGARNEPDFKVPRWDSGRHEVAGGDGPTDAVMASIMRKLFVVKERFFREAEDWDQNGIFSKAYPHSERDRRRVLLHPHQVGTHPG